MIFYKRITICNLFAYNDIQRINFVKQNNKPIYLLFGKNGFGKTSFIRSIKLLFAGSGLLNAEEKVPNVVLNFTNDRARGVFTPKTFLLGQNSDNGWQGAFNHSAVKNNQNNFYVELELEEEGQSVIIKREWSLFPDLTEKLTYKTEEETLYNNQALEQIEQILPLNFLQFFVFDGEEIESMADEISTELKEKIQNMLNIAVLDNIIKQLQIAEKEFIQQSNIASETKSRLIQSEGELNSKIETLKNINFNIDMLNKEINEKTESLESKAKERDNKIISNSIESQKLQNLKDKAIEELNRAKANIIEFGGEILFLGLNEVYKSIFKELETKMTSNSFNKEDLEKLAKFSAKILSEKITFNCDKMDLHIALRDSFLEFIKNSDDYYKGVNKNTLNVTYDNANNNASKLLNYIKSAKNSKN